MKKITICLLFFALFAEALFAAPIHEAVKEGNIDRLKFLISKGAKVNARDIDGRTPLGMAAYNGHTETAKLLKKHGGTKQPYSPVGEE